MGFVKTLPGTPGSTLGRFLLSLSLDLFRVKTLIFPMENPQKDWGIYSEQFLIFWEPQKSKSKYLRVVFCWPPFVLGM
jgi:hypothetical protein